jgi:30S ribosomal protein S31
MLFELFVYYAKLTSKSLVYSEISYFGVKNTIFLTQFNNNQLQLMGKGDKKTKKGKISKGTFGVSRPKKKKQKKEKSEKEG